MSREDAAAKVHSMGADIDTTVYRNTDFVIMGQNAGPSKMKKIDQYNAGGAHIKIIFEPEFLEMIK